MALRAEQPAERVNDRPAAISVDGFKGINNRLDPSALGLEHFLSADDAICDAASYVCRRPGISTDAIGPFVDMHGTRDGRLLLVGEDGVLYRRADGALEPLAQDFIGGPFSWAELGYAVFASSSRAAWAVYPDRVVPFGVPQCPAPRLLSHPTGERVFRVACVFQAPDGRVGGTSQVVSALGTDAGEVIVTPPSLAGYLTRVYASAPDGAELFHVATVTSSTAFGLDVRLRGGPLDTLHAYPPPLSDCIASRRNQIVSAVWEPEQDRSVLYLSRAENPHVFDLDRAFQMVPGRVVLMAETPRGLTIGTETAIYIDPVDTPTRQVADFGVRSTNYARGDDSSVYFWTSRGLCRSDSQLELLTDAQFAVRPRARATVAHLTWRGSRYIVAHQGGVQRYGGLLAYDPTPIEIQHPHEVT